MRVWGALLGATLAVASPLAPQDSGPSHVKRLRSAPLAPGLRGRRLARIALAESLDALNRAEALEIEGKRWELGLAADERFERLFAVFSREGRSRFAPLTEPRALLRAGLPLSLDERTSYLFRVRPRRRAPVRESRVIAERPDGLAVASWTTGELIDGLLRKGVRLAAAQGDIWVGYLSDRDAATGAREPTRSLLFFEPRRFIPKAWRLPAAEVSERGIVVELGRERLSLRRGGDELIIEELPVAQ